MTEERAKRSCLNFITSFLLPPIGLPIPAPCHALALGGGLGMKKESRSDPIYSFLQNPWREDQ